MRRKDKTNPQVDGELSKEFNIYEFKQLRKLILTILFWSIIVSTIISVYYVYDGLSNKFHDTVNWEKSDNVAMATQEAYSLYLDEDDKAIYNEYHKKLLNVYDKQSDNFFNENANGDSINQLTEYYNQLTDGLKEREKETYDLVITTWNIREKFNSLINPVSGAIPLDTTLTEISEFLNENQDFILANKDKIKPLQQIYEDSSKIASDVTVINNLMLIFNDTYNLKDKKIEVKADTTIDKITYWDSNYKSLQLNWEIVNKVLNPTIKESVPIFKKHQDNITKFSNYSQEKINKESYEKWIADYNYYKENLITLPDFRNVKLENAIKWAEENGIVLKSIREYSRTVTKDVIISQGFRNNKILKGSALTVIVSDGEAPKPSSTSSSSSSSSNQSGTTTSTSSSIESSTTETEAITEIADE